MLGRHQSNGPQWVYLGEVSEMTTYVLGTHTSHDCSACLLEDGKIKVAIEKERITGIKHCGGDDNEVVQYCLKAAGITLKDVALVVQTANFDMYERRHCTCRKSGRIVDDAGEVVTISHHLAHMFSAVATSPFSEMASLVIDGCGNCYADCIDKEGAFIPERPPNRDLEQLYFEKDSYYEYAGGHWRTIYKDFSPFGRQQGYPMFPYTMHSIGGVYAAVSHYVFRGMDDPGKLMGLAPYGESKAVTGEMFTLKDGRAFVNYDWTANFDRPAADYSDFKNHFKYYADVALWAQEEIERAILYVVNSRYEMCPSDNLAYAGGVALNAVTNRLIKTRTKFKNLYIQPAAGDSGLAIGCAFYGWSQIVGGKRVQHNGSSHFGRLYRRDEIMGGLAENESRIQYREESDIVVRAAELLVAGKVIGWFQGGSEFGPRALGHRSILALPTSHTVKDFINTKIKFREDFRPFAPSVIAEDVSIYFDQDYESPYMILVSPVRAEWRDRIAAVVHRDGSCRIQTVHKEITPRYYALHEAVKQRSRISILLNTSLNRRGMPIVESPSDAIALFLETALDALIIEDWLLVKREHSNLSQAPMNISDFFTKICKAAELDSGSPPSFGVLQIVVTGVEDVWTMDFSRTPKIFCGRIPSPDHSVIVTWSALQQLVRDFGSLGNLLETGQLRVPGLAAHPHARLAVWNKLSYLTKLART
jgi:carbamoyltransferase